MNHVRKDARGFGARNPGSQGSRGKFYPGLLAFCRPVFFIAYSVLCCSSENWMVGTL